MEQSPTGTPIIPVKYVPWLMAAYVALEGILQAVEKTLGPQSVVALIIAFALKIAMVMGIASPGLRKQNPSS